ncbi:hypothetical protein HMF8227_02388 [Saliniradius amylolyticus]|uniref:NlpC/P60 domain-containing protein n=1 Tax=Saliniradius amylolyticus TaxID=2183582 RepID=A0A2S2E6G1_9ALTE|nr:NlpC/P60 family protein [Saliniradius amylolyticus]AWL12840.1 hypothetical protein HMF8227_02388 [Saliniradius amylolyticus]
MQQVKRLLGLLAACAMGLSFCTWANTASGNNVIGIGPTHLTPEFWLDEQSQPNQTLLSQQQIQTLNQNTFQVQNELANLAALPENYTDEQLLEKIQQTSSIPKWDRFYADGTPLSDQLYQKYLSNLNREGLNKTNPVQFGLVTERTHMRRFPSADKAYSSDMDLDIDRFIETGLFPGDAVAILHTSKDGLWHLARAYHYLAWLPAKDVAIGSKKQVLAYRNKKPFAIVTGAKVFTNFNPELPQLSEKQLDMGVRLPLLTNEDVDHNLYGQNPYASHVVELPYREEDGSLSIKPALISRNQDIHKGYLPFTRANIIKQGFKFLGERYGWGHDYNARDCTGFVSEVYRTFGILMPRNSTQQGEGAYGINHRFDDNSPNADKLKVIKELDIGDLVYIPGHVVMYIGEWQGQPYVIHDVHGMAYKTSEGEYYDDGTLNGVSVTPLLPMHLSESRSYLDAIYTIKSVR